MIYDCRAAELDKILNMLSNETACEDAAEIAKNLRPAASFDALKEDLKRTDDAYVLVAKFGTPSFSGLKNLTNALRRAQAGGILNLSEFLGIARVLSCFRNINDWRDRNAGMKTALDGFFYYIATNKFLEDKINSVVMNEDEVSDNASPALFDIRRKIRRCEQNVREQLDKLIRSAHYQKYFQDAIITQRAGRFVVPVKIEYRSEVPGLVHDTSSSGATVFVEPMSVVETNNEVRVLQSKEKAEIERILAELSANVGEFADSIIEGYNAAVSLNVIFAKANLGYKMKAVMPKINNEGKIKLNRARHPLIDSKAVVPIDIELGFSFDTLVITGPNTGGKTVALKTLALFTLMMMCGLMVPAGDYSELSYFENVYVNIGDEQSIEQSLSTFSSHMKGIISMLETADDKSLVILDELGSGTDPAEGAALAMAILETLRENGCKIAATTHYAELKEYALETNGVENACCEFDISTLKPTYRLLIGVPGKSNAFAISEKLGMDKFIVERARKLLSDENTRFSDIMEKLEIMRVSLENEMEKARKDREEAQKLKEEALEEREKAKKQAKNELSSARGTAAALVSRTRARADELLNELEEMKKNQNKALNQESKNKLRAGLRDLEKSADPVEKRRNNDYKLPRALKAGDRVLIFDIEKEADVISVSNDGKMAEVSAGMIKTRVKVSNLRLIEDVETRIKLQKKAITKEISQKSAITEIDLRGMVVEEALMEVDRAIDTALLTSIGQITIIHGKGTGALRAAIHQFLKKHKSIKTFRLGAFGEGEAGVTIATLK